MTDMNDLSKQLKELHAQAYSDMTFEDFAQRYHQKYFPAVPKEKFLQAVGANVKPEAPQRERGDVGVAQSVLMSAPLGVPFGDRAIAGLQTLSARNGGGGVADYDRNLQNVRDIKRQIEQDHPGASLTGQMIGSVVGPAAGISAARKFDGLLPKSLVSGGVNSGYGLMQGVSDSPDLTNLGDTAQHAAKGAAIGFGVGAPMPLVGRAVGGVIVQPLANAINGRAEGMSSKATKFLVDALRADGVQSVRDRIAKLGDEGMLADAGPSMLGRAQGVLAHNSEARSILVDALAARNKGTNARVQKLVDDSFGPAEDPALVTQAILKRRSEADKAYETVHANAPAVNIYTVLGAIDNHLETATGAQRKALETLKNELVERKQVPLFNPDGSPKMIADQEAGRMVQASETQLVPKSNSQTLHNIRQDIDYIIKDGLPGLGVPAGALQRNNGSLKLVRDELDNALKAQVPGMAKADAASSALAKRAEAVQKGVNLLDTGKTAQTPEAFMLDWMHMTPGERIALAKGNRGDIERRLDTRENDLSAGKNILKDEGDWPRQKLSMVHGDYAVNRAVEGLDAEAAMRATHNKVVEGSQTDLRRSAAQNMEPPNTELITPGSSAFGTAATTLKKWAQPVYQPILENFFGNPTKAYPEVATTLTKQGMERDAAVEALVQALMKRDQNAAMAINAGNNTALGASALASAYARQLQQQ